ncbi:CHAT domain-containing protein [Kamptonema sp. UHCC 0994]|uniref:CHAT domain-containing protein n=1 Tax=Kamptonema sp. UHCC 0994 TaxID=3031329 RepID=UPI0023B8902E|nr:CHAT domain-containing protein [Kamptonema sp. UHCC 0994]MDF0553083.1 CHAT domain-containing protein [Kamptonema sp. UHCC 0994]
MTQEFLLSVTPVGEDEYLVRTERVAPGVLLAEELVTWPVEEWLTLAQQLMNDPLLGLFEGKVPLAQGERNAKSGITTQSLKTSPRLNLTVLGQQLYNGLFQGNLRDSWTCAQAIAQHRREVLQLRLGLKGRRLPRLPWEVLHAADRPLATGTDVIFSRYQPGVSLLKQRRMLTPQQPLKILMAIAAPNDQDSLQLKREALHLQQELQNRATATLENNVYAPQIQLTILEQPDREQLTQALEQGQYQVLHYAGHSNLAARGGELYLVSDRTGLTETLSGDDLAGLLANNGIQMAVFNSCRSAYGDRFDGDDTGERNLAEALVKRGIPAVLAMAERIPDEVALTLTRLFYRNLNQGYPVDLSLSRARAGLISAYGSHQLYWALPILYLHSDFDGYLTGAQTGIWAEAKGVDATLTGNLSYPPSYPALRNGQQSEENLAGYDGFAPDEELESPLVPDFGDFADDEDRDDWDDEAQNSALIANFRHQLANNESQREEALSQRRQKQEHSNNIAQSQSYSSVPSSFKRNSQSQIPQPANPNSRQKPNPQTGQLSSKSARLKQAPVKTAKHKKKSLFWAYCLFPTGIVASMVLGLWFWQNRGPKPGEMLPIALPPITNSVGPNANIVNLKVASSSEVQAIAIQNFNQGKLSEGQQAVEELLDPKRRQALRHAEVALTAALETAPDDPEIKFLWGRLAWQSIQSDQNNNKYSVDDARRYWESALKSRPESVQYRNALAFALYVEGNLNQAYQVWLEALDLVEATVGKGPQPVAIAHSGRSEEALTAYAGLGLVRMQQAREQGLSPQQRTDLLHEAGRLREQVMAGDAESFQPTSLSQNWLWPQKAIGDWRSLQKM